MIKIIVKECHCGYNRANLVRGWGPKVDVEHSDGHDDRAGDQDHGEE